jgi:hypothetical protein
LEFGYAPVDVCGQPHVGPQVLAQNNNEFLKFALEASVLLNRGRRVARKQMPDLDEKLAGHGRDGGVAIAFAGEEFPAPFSQRCVATHAQDGLGTLDEEVAHVTAPAFANAEFDVFPIPALALTGIESDISHELLGAIKAPHVSDDRQQGEGVDLCSPSRRQSVFSSFHRMSRYWS